MPDPSTPSRQALAAALRRPLLQRFPADRAYPRAAFHAEGMPPPIAAFLDRTLDRWVEMERDRFREGWSSTEWFDAEDAAVQRAERAFFDALGRSARVPAQAWEETLGGAIDLVVRFLTVPARALTDALFEGAADPLPAAVIRERLPLFSAYPYLAEVATAYLDRKQPEPLAPSDLFALLDRIDRRFVSEYGREDWIALLGPLFALARHAPALDGVPASLLQRFFDAKGADGLADLVAETGHDVLDEAALRDALAPAFPDAPPESPVAEPDETEAEASEPEAPALELDDRAEPVEEDPVPPEPISASDEDTPAEADAPPALTVETDPALLDGAETENEAEVEEVEGEPDNTSDEDADAEAVRPLWERFAERTSDGDNVNARFGTPTLGTEHAASDEDADAVPLWKRFFARPDAEAPAPTPAEGATETAEAIPSAESTEADPDPADDSLDALEQRVLGPMPPTQRKRFIKHLFGGDAGKYVTVLHALKAAGSWTEASQIIARDVFRPSRINIYGEHAVAFTDAVEARFRK